MHDYDRLRFDTTLLGLVQHRVPLLISSCNQLCGEPGVGVWKDLMLEMGENAASARKHRQEIAAEAVLGSRKGISVSGH